MPYESLYVDSGRGVHKTGRALVTGDEILQNAVQQSLDEERTRNLRYILIDFSKVTELNVSTESVRQIVVANRKSATINSGICIAIVAPNLLAFGMSRMWQSLAYDLRMESHIFPDRATAIAWLKEKLGTKSGASHEFPSLW